MRPAAITDFKVGEYTISFEIKEEKVDKLVLSFKADLDELDHYKYRKGNRRAPENFN